MAYSVDLRERVIKFVKEGGSKAEASRRFEVSQWCVFDWINRGNNIAPLKPGPTDSWKLDRENLKAELVKTPDATLEELSEKMGTAISTVHYSLKVLKISRKKNHAVHRTKRRSANKIQTGN